MNSTSLPWLPPTFAALVAALLAITGSFYLSLGMGLVTCPLCYYQRNFAIVTAGILCVGLGTRARKSGYLNVLALIPAVASTIIALWQTFLVATGNLICPSGIFSWGSTSLQSLVVLSMLSFFLLVGCGLDTVQRRLAIPAVMWAILLAAGLAYGCLSFAPKPVVPAEPNPLLCHPPLPGIVVVPSDS